MRKRGRCRRAVSVRPFIRVPVKFVYCVETSKRIFKIFPASGSHTILVLSYQTLWQYSDEDAPNEGIECRWVGKNRDTLPISGLVARCQRCDHQVLYAQ